MSLVGGGESVCWGGGAFGGGVVLEICARGGGTFFVFE